MNHFWISVYLDIQESSRDGELAGRLSQETHLFVILGTQGTDLMRRNLHHFSLQQITRLRAWVNKQDSKELFHISARSGPEGNKPSAGCCPWKSSVEASMSPNSPAKQNYMLQLPQQSGFLCICLNTGFNKFLKIKNLRQNKSIDK